MPINKVSKKQVKSNREVTKAKQLVVTNQIDKYGYRFCEVSRRSDVTIDCAHLVKISRNKSLEAHPENIINLSRPLHSLWENQSTGTWEGYTWLNVFDKYQHRIHKLDPDYYNYLHTKAETFNN